MAQTNGRGFQGIDPDRISDETGRNDDSRAPQQQNKQQTYSQDRNRKMGAERSRVDSHERAAFHHDTAGFHHRQAATHTQNGNQGSADLHANAADKHGRAAWDHADQAQRYGSGMSKSNSMGSLRDRDQDNDRDVESNDDVRNDDMRNDNMNDDTRRNGRGRGHNQNQKS